MKLFKKIIKYTSYLLLVIVGLFLVLVLCINPLAKYAIQKFDTKYVGREITLDHININIFMSSVEITNFRIYEKNSKKTFVSWGKFYVRTNYMALFKHKIELQPIQFDRLTVNLSYKNGSLNFDDIIKKLSSNSSKETEKNKPKEKSKPWEIDISSVSITHGLFSFHEGTRDVRFLLSDYTLKVPNYNSVKEKINLLLVSKVNKVATISLNLKYDLKKQYYDAVIALKNFPMQTLNPYMTDFLRFNKLNSTLGILSFIKGNTKTGNNFSIKGDLKVTDLEFIDAYDQKLTSFKELDVNIDQLDIANNIYKINSISLTDPYFLFEMYPNGNSINRLFQQLDTSVVVTPTDTITSITPTSSSSSANVFKYVYDYFKQISQDLILNTYSANKLEIKNGSIVYHDFLVGEKMNIETSALNIATSRISSENDSVSATLTSLVNTVGKLNVNFKAEATNFKNMLVNIGVEKFPLTAINPYCKYYTGFPFKKGGLTLNTIIKIDDNKLDSKSHLLIEKPKLGKKDKRIRQYKVPLKLAFALLRDKKGNVDIDFPVDGNLEDPNYKIKPVVLKLAKNLLVKTVTAPVNLIGGLFSKKENTDIEIEAAYFESELTKKHKRGIKGIRDILADKPQLVAELDFYTDTIKERELLIIREIKKIYVNDVLQLDSAKFDKKMDRKIKLTDTVFVNFIDNKIAGRVKNETSIIDKALFLIGKEKINTWYQTIKKGREIDLQNYILTELSDVKDKLKVNQLSIDKNLLNPKYVITLDGVD